MDEEMLEYINTSGRSQSRAPFNVGIKSFKRLLSESNLSKSDRNKAVKIYKQRIADRMIEVKKQIDEAIEKKKEEKEASSKTAGNLSKKGIDNGAQV